MELQEAYAAVQAEGAELLAVSVDSMEDAQLMVQHAGATFPVLADASQTVARSYGIFDLLGDGLAAPAAYIIDRNGVRVGEYVGQNINDRVPTESILQFLRAQ